MSLSPSDQYDDGGFQEYAAYIFSEQYYYGICWPHHCKTCSGYGAFYWREPHGENMSDPCNECTAFAEKGPQICPRCAFATLTEDGSGPCRHCGWDYSEGGMPLW